VAGDAWPDTVEVLEQLGYSDADAERIAADASMKPEGKPAS
jgi:hypothetical protein